MHYISIFQELDLPRSTNIQFSKYLFLRINFEHLSFSKALVLEILNIVKFYNSYIRPVLQRYVENVELQYVHYLIVEISDRNLVYI